MCVIFFDILRIFKIYSKKLKKFYYFLNRFKILNIKFQALYTWYDFWLKNESKQTH